MRRTRTAASLLLTLTLTLTVTAAEGGASVTEGATVRVTYITGSSVYVEAGREDGLSEGDRLEVIRDGRTVAVLEVKDLSSHRASCDVVDGTITIEVGDSVRLPHSPDPAPAAAAVAAAPQGRAARTRSPRRLGDRRIRGRAGLRYLWIRDRGDDRRTFSEPSLDFRLDGSNLAGGLLDLAVDVRARRSYTTRADAASESEGRSRVYRTALTLHDKQSRYRFTAGRQLSRSMASLGIFDGVSADVDHGRWTFGALTGTQPNPLDFSYSSEVREHGIYARAQSARQTGRRWAVTAGLLGSYAGGVDREYLYAQGLYSGPRLSVYVAEELDYRDDDFESKRSDRGGDLSLTGSMINLRYRLGRAFTLRAGYDSRRSVRLYRDVVTPETDLDDSLRQGLWVGVSHRFNQRYLWGLDVKTRSGGSAGTADSASLRFGVTSIGRAQLSLDSRGTYYTNDLAEGWLVSLGSAIDLGAGVRFGISAGVRDDSNLANPDLDDQVVWYGVDLDFSLGRAWYAQISVERNDGDFEKNDQAYLSATYRF